LRREKRVFSLKGERSGGNQKKTCLLFYGVGIVCAPCVHGKMHLHFWRVPCIPSIARMLSSSLPMIRCARFHLLSPFPHTNRRHSAVPRAQTPHVLTLDARTGSTEDVSVSRRPASSRRVSPLGWTRSLRHRTGIGKRRIACSRSNPNSLPPFRSVVSLHRADRFLYTAHTTLLKYRVL